MAVTAYACRSSATGAGSRFCRWTMPACGHRRHRDSSASARPRRGLRPRVAAGPVTRDRRGRDGSPRRPPARARRQPVPRGRQPGHRRARSAPGRHGAPGPAVRAVRQRDPVPLPDRLVRQHPALPLGGEEQRGLLYAVIDVPRTDVGVFTTHLPATSAADRAQHTAQAREVIGEPGVPSSSLATSTPRRRRRRSRR